jgi:hypothetical protein
VSKRFVAEGFSFGTNKRSGLNVSGGTNLGTWTNPMDSLNNAAFLAGDDFLFFSTDSNDNSHFIIKRDQVGIGLGVDGDLTPIRPSITLAFGDTNTGFDWIGEGNFAVKTNGIERARFVSNGNVGIGNDTPNYKLDVNGDVNANAYHGDGSNLTGITSALRTYDSGWFAVDGNTEYTRSHNLGTTKVLALMYSATDSTGNQMQLEGIVGYSDLGITIASITTTQVTIYTQYKFNWINGYRAGITSGYARIVMMALE